MRNLLIAFVLLSTALTFYSALWFKSESIEDDITMRVTANLDEASAENVAIDVDGRHVTLSGIVYDEAVEVAYLDAADQTHGALGPIDGLIYQADGGYISALKNDAGITLRGTVPNEDLRATLIASATAATGGVVTDALTIGGPVAAWQDEAAFGVSKLASLRTGTLMAASGSYALSGTTDDDPATVTDALADREGWQALVSSSIAEQSLSGDVARLNRQVTDQAGEIEQLDTVVTARDATIAALETDVSSRDTTINGLELAVGAATAQIGSITADRDAVGLELETLRANLTEGQTESEDLRAELIAGRASLADAQEVIADRDTTIEGMTADISGLETELANRQTTLGSKEAQVATLEADLSTANQTITDLNGQLGNRDEMIASLKAETQTTANLGSDQVAGLNTQLQQRDATIAALNTDAAEAQEDIARLTGQLADRDGTLAQTSAQVATLEAEIEDLSGAVAERDGSLAEMAAQIAALSATAQTGDATAELEGQITELSAVVANREATIAALRTQPDTSATAQQCADRAGATIEGGQINFATSTADINRNSVALLERLTGIALACVGEGLTVVVGGHTDAQGNEAKNQALSEARAQAVVAFMTERGVPSEGLQAVGFGESQPIANNSTPSGRAENRRISFEWQAR